MKARTILLLGATLMAPTGFAAQAATSPPTYDHVLLLNIDGMHAIDFLAWLHYARFGIGNDALRSLALHGVTFLNALTPVPSNDLPGMVAEVTGATPKTSGVYHARGYDRTYFPPGSNCRGDAGAAAIFDQTIDKNSTRIDGGGTLGKPLTQIDANKLPTRLLHVNGNAVCRPVLPHEFLKVNTVFEEIKRQKPAARTAWADVHPTYEMLSGPSGGGIDDLFTPEIMSVANASAGTNYTQSYIDARRFDSMNVHAVLNEIDGLDSAGQRKVGVPALFGMSFEEVAVGQQLAVAGPSDPASRPDDPLPPVGGYLAASPTGAKDGECKNPGFWNTALVSEQYLSPSSRCPGLDDPLRDLGQLDYVSYEFLQIINALTNKNLMSSTLIIICAKNGNAPIDTRSVQGVKASLYAPAFPPAVSNFFADYDDVSLIWLDPQQRTPAHYNAVQSNLVGSATELHLQSVYGVDDLTAMFQSPFVDSRVPDLIGETTLGTIYLNDGETVREVSAKHGGFSNDDRNVVLVVSAPTLGGGAGVEDADPVETRQIAPTVLSALGLSYARLQGSIQEGTQPLPIKLH